MYVLLDKAVDRLGAVIRAGSHNDRSKLAPLIVALPPIQDAYESLLSESLTLLMSGYRDECVHQLQIQREKLAPSLERLSPMIEQLVDTDSELVKMIVEYLYTRARLVDEIKMFPDFGLELLKNLSVDDSLEKVILRLEFVMTGRQGLYSAIMADYEKLSA